MDRAFRKEVVKMFVLIVGSVLLCRVTRGYFAVILSAAGLWMAMTNRTGYALACYVFFPLLVIVNPFLIGNMSSVYRLSLRFTPLVMGLVLACVASSRSGRQRLPLGFLLAYLLCALISSVGGYCPQISCLKILNMVLFIMGLWFGTQNIHKRPKDVVMLRAFFTAMVFFVVFGSLATLPFPAIAYPLATRQLLLYGQGMQVHEAIAEVNATAEIGGVKSYLAGVTNHSQCLGPMLACCFGWLLSDMLFVIRRAPKIHILTLSIIPFMLFFTRSRTGLLSFSVAAMMVFFFAGKRLALPFAVKRRISTMMLAFCLVIAAGAIVGEIRSDAISRWIRKTDAVESDQRSTSEAFTGSRQRLMQNSMRDFLQNPLFGMGFQVDERSAEMYQHSEGLVLSASIEKGFLPTMVLGETGALGGAVFLMFLVSFYMTCIKKRYIVTVSLFTIFLVTNAGEATFFSPGGNGGIEWLFTVVGGFVIDSMLIYRRDFERRMQACLMMQMGMGRQI